MRVAKIIHSSYVDGPGQRAVLYTQRCPVRCPGCQSPHLWDEDGGQEMVVDQVAVELLSAGLPVTISGGEPFAQAEAVADLIATMRLQNPGLEVVVYSGFVIEDLILMARAIPAIWDVLAMADVLVDGPYIAALDHDRMQWRGAENQRPIDLQATLFHPDAREVSPVHYPGRLVLLDWDTQVLQVTADGEVVGTAGAMEDLFAEGLEPARMCGQTR